MVLLISILFHSKVSTGFLRQYIFFHSLDICLQNNKTMQTLKITTTKKTHLNNTYNSKKGTYDNTK